MQFTVYSDVVKSTINNVMHSIDSKPKLPVLAYVLIDVHEHHVTFTGTNLDEFYTESVSLIGTRSGVPGSVCVEAKSLKKILSTYSSNVALTFTLNNSSQVTISNGNETINVKSLSSDEYPAVPHDVVEPLFTVRGSLLKDIFKHVLLCAAKDTKRPVLNCIDINSNGANVEFVTADGNQLGIYTYAVGDITPFSWNLSMHAAKNMVKTIANDADYFFGYVNDSIVVQSHTQRITVRDGDGIFPNYRIIIPNTDYRLAKVFVDETTPVVNVLKRAGVFAADNANSVTLAVSTAGTLTLRAKSHDLGDYSNTLNLVTLGEADTDIIINYEYLLDAIKQYKSDVQLGFYGHERPMTVTYGMMTYIIMPMSKSKSKSK